MNDMTSTLASTPVLSVWTARIADAASLERLAALNDLPRPSGPALIGAADGRVVAALSLGGDPSSPTPPSRRIRWSRYSEHAPHNWRNALAYAATPAGVAPAA